MQGFIYPFLLLLSPVLLKGQAMGIKPGGNALKTFYLSLDVEGHWVAGTHINWETGEADKPEATSGIHTHCSAFVAAACKKLNLYILRPPEHGQLLLANAQYEWLSGPEAIHSGWRPLRGDHVFFDAQERANNGEVVIAICMNPDPKKPGHAALVIPAATDRDKIEADGPFVIMAGNHNYNKISLQHGFRSHILSWPATNILFFYNEQTPRL